MSFSKDDLKRAAAAVDRAMLENLPLPEQPSPQLMARLDGLVRTQKRKTAWKRALSRVAACVMVALMLGGTWLAVDAEARNILLNWFQDFSEEQYTYQFVDMTPPSELPEYEFRFVPEGISSGERTIEPSFHRKGYDSKQAHFHLTYFYPKSGSSYVIRPYRGVTITHSTLTIHGSQADLYHLTGSRIESRLIWVEPISGILFHLSGDLPEEADLVRLMESLYMVDPEQK